MLVICVDTTVLFLQRVRVPEKYHPAFHSACAPDRSDPHLCTPQIPSHHARHDRQSDHVAANGGRVCVQCRPPGSDVVRLDGALLDLLHHVCVPDMFVFLLQIFL